MKSFGKKAQKEGLGEFAAKLLLKINEFGTFVFSILATSRFKRRSS